jgi:hypothetical protein
LGENDPELFPIDRPNKSEEKKTSRSSDKLIYAGKHTSLNFHNNIIYGLPDFVTNLKKIGFVVSTVVEVFLGKTTSSDIRVRRSHCR